MRFRAGMAGPNRTQVLEDDDGISRFYLENMGNSTWRVRKWMVFDEEFGRFPDLESAKVAAMVLAAGLT